MKSIRGRLLTAFIGIIAVLILASLVLFYINWRTTAEYRLIVDVMTAEYRLVHNTSILIDAYNVQIQSAGTDTTVSSTEIKDAKEEIQSLFVFLDTAIADYRARSNYLGFKSSVEKLVNLIDESLQKSAAGNIEDYFTDYNEANKQYGFVRENGTTLIFSQLEYSTEIQMRINETYKWSTLSGLGSLLVLLLGSLLFVTRFARNLTDPLRRLTIASEKLADGDMDTSIVKNTLRETEEVRTLAESFEYMAKKLKESQENLKQKAEESEDHAVELAEKLTEIERMNRLMVNRELKMVELKTELEMLKQSRS